MIHIVYGNEPYFKSKTIRELELSERESMSHPDMNLCKYSSFSEEIVDFLSGYPFLDSKRVAIVEAETLEELEPLVQFIADPGVEVIARVSKVDERKKLFKTLKKEHPKCLILCNKLSERDLKRFVQDLFAEKGMAVSPNAVRLFIQRAHYERDEICLYFFQNTVEDLLLLCGKEVSDDEIVLYVPDNETDNVFVLSKHINNGNISGIKHQISLMDSDDAIGPLMLLHQNFRVALKAALLGGKAREYGINYVPIQSRDIGFLSKSLICLTDTVKGVMSGHIKASEALLFACMHIIHLLTKERRSQ